MDEFVEWTSKTPKPYKCKRCGKEIQYAKFFGSDKKILTTDGKKPYFDKDRKPMSNTGWPTNPNTKQIHECDPGPKGFPESELKISNTLESGWGDNSGNTADSSSITVVHNSQPLNDMDKKVIEKTVDDAYHDAEFMIWTLQGVEKACKKSGIELGPVSGMIFKEVCENIRRRNERE